jgi:hypothetical protein
MKVAKQLSVAMSNQPGQLSLLCKKLAVARANIRAISVVETSEQCLVRLVVDKTAAAKKVIEEAGMALVVSDVLLVDMTNKPGMLGTTAEKLSKARINIQYVYGTTGPGAMDAVMVFGLRREDLKKARELLALA